MGTPRIDQAELLVAKIDAILVAADLPKVVATLDAHKIPSGARHGVVVVSPPSLEFPTWDNVVATWDVHVIAGPPDNYMAAWKVIDSIVEALTTDTDLPVTRAEPGQFQPLQNGAPLWAYTITLTD